MNWHELIAASAWKAGDVLPSHNDDCMVCGRANERRMLTSDVRVSSDGRSVETTVVFGAAQQGAPFYAHGGAVAAALDDVSGYLSFLLGQMFVTAHLEVDYRRPVALDHEYDLVAWCTSVDERKIYVRAELRDGQDLVAEAGGLFIVVDIDHFRP